MALEAAGVGRDMWYEWPQEERRADARRWMGAPLSVLALPKRAHNALVRSGFYPSVGDLMLAGEEVRAVRSLGEGSLRHVDGALAPHLRRRAPTSSGHPESELPVHVEAVRALAEMGPFAEGPWYVLPRQQRSIAGWALRGTPLRRLPMDPEAATVLAATLGLSSVTTLIEADSQQVNAAVSISVLEQAHEAIRTLARRYLDASPLVATLAEALDRLGDRPNIAEMHVTRIGFGRETSDIAAELGAVTVEDLARCSAAAAAAAAAYDHASIARLERDVSDLAEWAGGQDAVDWRTWWRSRNVALVPAPGASVCEGMEMLLERWVLLRSGERSWSILRHRYGLGGAERHTLQELGDVYGLTRERIRQIEGAAVAEAVVFAANPAVWQSAAAPAVVDPRLDEAWQSLLALLRETLHVPIGEVDLARRANRILESDAPELEPLVEIAATAVGVMRHSTPDGGVFVWTGDAGPNEAVLQHVERVGTLLTRQTAGCLSPADVADEVNRAASARRRITADEARAALDLSGVVERLPDGCYRGRFERLANKDLRIERVLRDADQPLHVTEILSEFDRLPAPANARPMTLRRVWWRLQRGDPFVPASPSGYWTLRELVDADGGTVLDLMERCLEAAGQPLAAHDVFGYLAPRKPTSMASVESYLAGDDRFLPVDYERWGLSAGPVPWSRRRWDRRGTARFVAKTFREAGVSRMPLGDLVAHLEREAGVPERIARSMLATNPAVVVRPGRDGPPVAEFEEKHRKLLTMLMPRARQRPERMHVVHARIRSELSGRPDRSMPLAELRDLVVRDLDVPQSSFDAYIRRMPDIERLAWPGHRGKLLRLRDDPS